jgi:signal transduction histidine kinase
MVLLAPTLLVVTLLALGMTMPGAVPPVIPSAALAELRAEPTSPMTAAEAPVLFVVQALIGLGFAVAAWLAYRAYRRSGRSGDLLMAAGLVFAAFSQVHSAIHPGSYAGLVTTADLLRLAFYGILVLGLVAESRQDIADLRAATAEVRRLAAAQFAAAGLEERARLAREIHDGLAQDLWYAKLKHSRLTQLAPLDEDARALSVEVESAIDAALAEARHAVAAMRAGSADGTLLEILDRLVADFNDRFAIRATLEHAGPPPAMGARAQAETLRIVQEALTNARKHADATVVRVRVATDGDIRIVIADNGRGFEPGTEGGGFGLESMRQRAALIGADLNVASEPQNGTRVELTIPQGR